MDPSKNRETRQRAVRTRFGQMWVWQQKWTFRRPTETAKRSVNGKKGHGS